MRLMPVQLGQIDDSAACHGSNLDTWATTSFGDHGEQTAIAAQGRILLAAIKIPPLNGTLPIAAGHQTQTDAERQC